MFDVGRRIKELRTEQGKTAKKLAEETDLDPSQISKIEKGESNPSLDALFRICVVLNISLSEFFATDSEEIPVHLRELLQTSKSLSIHQIKQLNEFLKSLNESDS